MCCVAWWMLSCILQCLQSKDLQLVGLQQKVVSTALLSSWSWPLSSPPSYPLGPLRPVTLASWSTVTSDSDHMTTLSYETNDPGCRAGDPSHFVLSYHFVLASWASQASDPDPMVLHVRSASVAFHSTENQSNVQVADQQVAAPVETFRSWNSNR